MIKYLLSIFIVIFSITMCSKNNIDVVSMEEFQSNILDSNTVVLDVRTEEEFHGPLGHIKGAILIPIDELSARVNELNEVKNKDIYVVCRSGNRSNFGKDILRENNFNAINIDGGMLAWNPLDNE
ncbi:MAG: rhodanese-like domain-containing protein [Candidatus Neomarinimicrobiota bacterium]